MNLIINVEDDDKLVLADDSAVLAWQGIGTTPLNTKLGKRALNYSAFRKRNWAVLLPSWRLLGIQETPRYYEMVAKERKLIISTSPK